MIWSWTTSLFPTTTPAFTSIPDAWWWKTAAAAMGERTQFASGRIKVPTIVVLSGKTDSKEYTLTNKLTTIGKSAMATIKLRGWFKPQMAAQINQRDDGYYIGSGDKVPVVNGVSIPGPTRLDDGDLVEVSGVRLNFIVRE